MQQTGSTSDGRFSDMENLSGDKFPLLSSRNPRAYRSGVSHDEETGNNTEGQLHRYKGDGILAAASVAGHFVICSSEAVYIDGRRVPDCRPDKSTVRRSITALGKDIFIMPDGILIKEDGDNGYSGKSVRKKYVTEIACLTYCDTAGNTNIPTIDPVRPLSPEEGDVYIDCDSGALYLMKFYSDKGWQTEKKVYCKIDAPGIEYSFNPGDYIFIPYLCSKDSACRVISTGKNYIIADGRLDNPAEAFHNFTAERKPPLTDICIEHNNRIWGCRYGMGNSGQFVNEIYACVPGNPYEWYTFEGTAMDSYTVSVGCSGEFTGAAVQGNDILFFKEDHIIRISGDTPSDFTVQTFSVSGVEKGSRESVVNINDKIFYKGRDGIMCYDGTYPEMISRELGVSHRQDAAAGVIGNKYYVAMTDDSGKRNIFVYDINTSFWYKEDDEGDTRYIVRHDGCLFYVTRVKKEEDGFSEYVYYLWNSSYISVAPDIMKNISDVSSGRYVSCGRVSWYFDTGRLGESELPERQILRSVLITLSMSADAVAELYIIPVGITGEKRKLCEIVSHREGAFSVPVNIPPCHSFVLRAEGRGEVTIHSVVRRSEITGEVKNYGTR